MPLLHPRGLLKFAGGADLAVLECAWAVLQRTTTTGRWLTADDRHLLHDADGPFAQRAPTAIAEPQSFYPQGFSAQRFIEVVEEQAVWDGI